MRHAADGGSRALLFIALAARAKSIMRMAFFSQRPINRIMPIIPRAEGNVAFGE
jgi:hypothetical protein